MRNVLFTQLNQLDISIFHLTAIECSWPYGTVGRHEFAPRETNLLLYLMKGEWQYEVDGKHVLTLRAGDILFAPDGCRYLSRCQSENRETAVDASGICFDFKILDEHAEELALGNQPLLLYHDASGRYLPLFQQALELCRAGTGGKLSAKAIIFRVLDELAVQLRSRTASAEYRSILPALRYIETHPETDIVVESLARMCYLSEVTFRRRFRMCTGESPIRYRNKLRIEKADELLKSRLYTVESVSATLGFTDSAHFCKTYRKLRGKTPTGRV